MIANTIRSCFPVAAKVVADKADEINKLNVFPVPDGDTGTNMSLTLGTVVKEVESLPANASVNDIAKAITHGSLMGARGNSGVITSQILRGVAEGLTGAKGPDATTADIASALRNGVKVAFKAVRKPVEGTILTVLKDVSARADQMERAKATPQEALDAIVVEAYESVARTPDLLPVLKENGVVDSGAFGLATFIEAFVNAYEGKAGEVSDFDTSVTPTSAKAQVANVVDIEINDDWEGSEFRYCTEFLFHADSQDFDEEANLKYLSSMGDCELLVGTNPDYKIHVHTNRPDRVLRHMLHRGQIFNVFVHNMDLEAQERTEGIREDKESSPRHAAPKKGLGFVAVAAGSGQAEILRSLGVDVIVSGGQTMNPSTADILEAIEACNATSVIVLPNNGNIRMAAEAAVSAC
ncbi:DAK2 domain-containing protein, partial [Olsenella phocaeensis]